jgi:uncharacterized C2H2 Zn-finger protein
MWLLFHRNAKTRTVRDGETFVEDCPECGQRARFVEVEISENFGLFFVDVVGDKERAFRCSACGEVFDLKDQAPAPPHAKPVVPAPVAKKPAPVIDENRIEDELAELKKRLGR